MTTYNAISNDDIDPESPLTAALFQYLRDNPIAIAEGASGAPKIQHAALDVGIVEGDNLGDYTAGDYVEQVSQQDVTASSMTKIAEIKVPRAGTIRTRIVVITGDSDAEWRIYVNGVATGTLRTGTGPAWNEDIAVDAGDLVQLYARENSVAGGIEGRLNVMASNPIGAGVNYNYVLHLA